MPTVARIGEFRFFFYSLENREPAHIHVERDDSTAKFWLSPVHLASNKGFRPHEVNRIARLVEHNVESFREAWNEHFDQSEFVRRQRDSDR